MSLFNELKRRNVFRVGAAYVVAAWLLIQVAETIFPLFGFDDTPARIVVIVLAVAFIPAMVLAWAFEWTPEGLQRDGAAGIAPDGSRQSTKTMDRLIIVGLALGLAYFTFDKFALAPQRLSTEIEAARQEGRIEGIVDTYADKSIAVLPFSDMSPEGDQEYLSDGIAEELLNLLATVPELRVISRTSAFSFKGQTLEVTEIAKRLKVGHVLEGSVRKAGNTVRITAQLIDARSDTHLWSHAWDRSLDDVFAIQDEIAGMVVQELKLRLLSTPAGKQGPAPAAYQLYLKGLHLLASRDPSAQGYFEQAIEIAPDFAPAHASLGKLLALLSSGDEAQSTALLERAEREIQRALELDPKDSDALATRGLMLWNIDLEQARRLFERAIEVNPNNLDAYRWLGLSYRNIDSVRYLEYMQSGYKIAPTIPSASTNLFTALSRFGRYEEAMAVARDLHYLYPSDPGAYALAGSYYGSTGQMDKALRSYYRAYRMAPESVDQEIANIGWMLMDLGPDDLELAYQWAQERMDNNPRSGHATFQKIVLTYLLGRNTEAVKLINDVADEHPTWWILLGRSYLMVANDPASSLRWWEYGLATGSDVRYWDAYRIVDYAFALEKTGDHERARQLIDSTLARMEQQMQAGVWSEGEWELKFYAAILHAMRGEKQQALAYLNEDAESRGLSCLDCLKTWPQFDGIRDDPAIQALIVKQDEINARWRQRLHDDGLLLTPTQIRAAEDFDFDPFAVSD